MNLRDKLLTWNLEKLPTWVLLELEATGIPLSIGIEDLTGEQCQAIACLHALMGLVEKGLVEVAVNPETGMPEYTPILPPND